MKKTTIMLCLALVSGGAFAQGHDNHAQKESASQKMAPMFKDGKIGASYGIYIQLKDELVASNYEGAKRLAAELVKSLGAVKNNSKALAEATKLANSSTIKDQRLIFSALSSEMSGLIKGQLSMGEVYLAYCPMANGNTGASWLANEKDINNPYFGDMMLKCGSVKETIK